MIICLKQLKKSLFLINNKLLNYEKYPPSLNSDGEPFHQYQQNKQLHLTSDH